MSGGDRFGNIRTRHDVFNSHLISPFEMATESPLIQTGSD